MTRNLGIFAQHPAAITEAGKAETSTNEPLPGALEGIKGKFLLFILISLLDMRSTLFEARGLGGLVFAGPLPLDGGRVKPSCVKQN